MKNLMVVCLSCLIDFALKIKEKFDKFTAGLCYVLVVLVFEIRMLPGRVKRLFWNRGLKLFWYRLWIRKNEFHESLDIDVRAMLDMNNTQRQKYLKDLMRRRQIAHERDLADH